MAHRTEEEAAMRPTNFRRFFNQRFVQTMEVFGYLLCALIGIGFAYSVWVKVDIVVPVEGTLTAPTTTISAPADLTVTSWAVEPGAQVTPGTPLCSYVSDPIQRDTARARTLITQALDSLADPNPAIQIAADHSRQAIAALPAIDGEVLVSSSAEGIAAPSPAALPGAFLGQGDPLVHVVDVTQLQLSGAVVGSPATQVAEGNPVRVTDPLTGAELSGHVSSVQREGVTANLVLAFTPLAQDVADAYAEEALRLEAVAPPAQTKAGIVVGRQSLFKSVFGRR